MASFVYRAVSRAGETLAGELEAPDRAAAVAQLHGLGTVPLTVEPLAAGGLGRLGGWRALLQRELGGGERLGGEAIAAAPAAARGGARPAEGRRWRWRRC